MVIKTLPAPTPDTNPRAGSSLRQLRAQRLWHLGTVRRGRYARLLCQPHQLGHGARTHFLVISCYPGRVVSLQRTRQPFGRDLHVALGEGMGGFERGDEMLGQRRPCCVIPLDGDDDRAIVSLADSEAVEMGDANDRRAVVQIGHQLDALLEGDGVVFFLAGRGLPDQFRLTWDVAELRECGDEDRLGCRRNGIIVEEGVRIPTCDAPYYP
jgi:hypothetical protein